MKGTIHEPFHHSFNIKSHLRNARVKTKNGYIAVFS